MRRIGLAGAIALVACAAHSSPATQSSEPPLPAAAAPAKTRYKNVPPNVLSEQVIESTTPRLPDMTKVANGRTQLAGTYKVCVDANGQVSVVDVISSIVGADQAIADTLRTWKYKPQPVPICGLYRFVFLVRR